MTKSNKPKAGKPDKKRYVPTKLEQTALDRVTARLRGRPRTIRVQCEVKGGRSKLSLDHQDPITGGMLLMDQLGIAEPDFMYELVRQIVSVASKGEESDAKAANSMIAGIVGMKPRDEAEAMLISQMMATHDLAMTLARRLNHVENIDQQDSAANALTKVQRTYVAQMSALKQYRTGGEQRVIVQRVDVRDGGQAVVSMLNPVQGGGAPSKNGEQPHALVDARGSAMLCDVQEEPEAVPRPGGPGTLDLPDARRDESGRPGRKG